MLIQKLGNKLDRIKSLYEELKGESNSSNCTRPFKELGIQKVVCSILGVKVSKIASFFSWIERPTSCREWHVDGDNRGRFKYMIIASYPLPTWILKLSDKTVYHCSTAKDEIDTLIADKKVKLIEPNPGDIYKLSMDVVHKTNPKADRNIPHMCLRVYLEE